jgi:hypothetical protein
MRLFSQFPSGITAAFSFLLTAVLPIRAEVSNMAPRSGPDKRNTRGVGGPRGRKPRMNCFLESLGAFRDC